MKLSRFIDSHMEEILAEWEAFARKMSPAAEGLSVSDLRDHAQQMLRTIALDLETAQSPKQQEEKSKEEPQEGARQSSAGKHGRDRETIGFSFPQLLAEFRALRASVLRLWLRSLSEITEETSEEIIRFNEAIDQAVAESGLTFSDQTNRVRMTFLAVLGHDLRSPLAAIANIGELLTMPTQAATWEIGDRVKRNAAIMTAMVNDLLEYAGNELGSKMPIDRTFADVRDILQAALYNAHASHPNCPFDFDVSDSVDLTGSFDSVRLQQVMTNLLNNAAQYRSEDRPVTLGARSEMDSVIVEVRNYGPVIPSGSLNAIFEPLVQLTAEGAQEGRPPNSLGLGLFIAREITLLHGGTITVDSSEGSGTVFTVRLPRRQEKPE